MIYLIILGVLSWLILPPRCETCGAELKTYTFGKAKTYCEC
jgi:hypothetical protein